MSAWKLEISDLDQVGMENYYLLKNKEYKLVRKTTSKEFEFFQKLQLSAFAMVS